jgi:hypothetical protein
MQREEALNYLGLPAASSEDELIESIENQLFSIRDYFLRQPVVIALYRSRIARLHQLEEVTASFGIALSPKEEIGFDLSSPVGDEVSLYRIRELRLAHCRGFMAKRLHLQNCIAGAEAMIAVELAFERDFLGFFSNIVLQELPVKASDRPDSAWMIDRLNQENWMLDKELSNALSKEKTRIAGPKS